MKLLAIVLVLAFAAQMALAFDLSGEDYLLKLMEKHDELIRLENGWNSAKRIRLNANYERHEELVRQAKGEIKSTRNDMLRDHSLLRRFYTSPNDDAESFISSTRDFFRHLENESSEVEPRLQAGLDKLVKLIENRKKDLEEYEARAKAGEGHSR
ncbi:hypothetical protein IE53DRAFT_365510 [Violaceomyces palustris]|uniref:Uncharacterized protein n=1 Tax=Violaceomyces palustris TaxID=1673888 RepID=A0ACD0P8M4_9BASI|nr:hypothetical protein IE53DRAFT_365510 [Violaceomyces palustris]